MRFTTGHLIGATVRCTSVGFAVVAALLLTSGPMWAQETAPGNKREREGFYIGIGLGRGTLLVEGADAGSSLTGNLRVGTALSQTVLVGVRADGWAKRENDETLTLGTLTGAVQYYPSATGGLFVNGGIGVARLTFTGSEALYGVGFVFGVGYDIRVGRNISITPFLGGYGSSINETDIGVGQVGVGVTFH